MRLYWNLICLLLLSAILGGCEHAGSKAQADEPPALDQKIYALQHRLMPKWLFQVDSAFFDDLYRANLAHFRSSVAEFVSPEYAEQIVVQPLEGQDAVLIIFPEPESMPLCYYVLMRRKGDQYGYLTYERALDIDDSVVVGVVGSWSKSGHGNLGPRTYRDAQSFVREIMDEE